MELRHTFDAESKSTWDVLNRGFGFYIPPYQRDYNWDESHIGRLFEDIGHGLTQLLGEEKKDSITFIGTLIVIKDTQPQSIAPNTSESDLPNKILPVIDGQQRLTTILLMNICLHDKINRLSTELKEKEEPAFTWLCERTIEVGVQLQETFEENRMRGEEVYQWQPRMIRAYVDSWSLSEHGAKYESPIAAFIHGYSKRIYDANENRVNEPYIGEDYIDKTDVLWKNYEKIQNLLEIVYGGGDEDLEMPPLEEVAQNVHFQKAILKEEFPESVCDILSNEGNDDFKELIRLVFFANFLMHRVGVTVVSAPGVYAFDMFESLNTTGEPLTVLETFRPKVIESEGLDKYENSDSRKYMRTIEEYLGQFDVAKKRQDETSKLLTSFALAESGKKLPSDSLDQRRYIRNLYENLPDLEEKRNLVQHLSHAADFMANVWEQEDRAFSSISEFADKNVVLMCIGVLGRANPVTIGPLTRFYAQVLLARSDSRTEVVNELEGAIKAMTAFFALWRGSGRTTGELTAQYQELMAKGFDDVEIRPFSRSQNVGETSGILTAEELRRALRYALGRGGTTSIKSKGDWVRRSAERPVYQLSQPLTRFLLFASTHNTFEDDQHLGLSLPARTETLDMFTWERWGSDLTIEHVAPQERSDGWQELLYEKSDLLDYLGNLTLLPKSENSSLKNRPWYEKRQMYRALSLPTHNALETCLEEAQNLGIQLGDSTEALLRAGKYLQHLSAIWKVEEWNDEFIQKRSRRLAKIVWRNIASWLGFDEE